LDDLLIVPGYLRSVWFNATLSLGGMRDVVLFALRVRVTMRRLDHAALPIPG
jgi:hypothetical protein